MVKFALTFILALAFCAEASAQYRSRGLLRSRSSSGYSSASVKQVQFAQPVVAHPVIQRDVQVPVTRLESRQVEVQVPVTTLETRQVEVQQKAVILQQKSVQQEKVRQRSRLFQKSRSYGGGC